MANALRVVCFQTWYSSPLAVSPLGVSFTPLLETGVTFPPFRGFSGLDVVPRYLAEFLPPLDHFGVLLLRHEMEELLQVLVLQTDEPLISAIGQRLIKANAVSVHLGKDPLAKNPPVLGIAGCN